MAVMSYTSVPSLKYVFVLRCESPAHHDMWGSTYSNACKCKVEYSNCLPHGGMSIVNIVNSVTLYPRICRKCHLKTFILYYDICTIELALLDGGTSELQKYFMMALLGVKNGFDEGATRWVSLQKCNPSVTTAEKGSC